MMKQTAYTSRVRRFYERDEHPAHKKNEAIRRIGCLLIANIKSALADLLMDHSLKSKTSSSIVAGGSLDQKRLQKL